MSRRERQKRRTRHRGHPIKRVALMSFGVLICAAVVGALTAVGWVVAVADSAPNLSDLKPRAPHPLTQVFAADGTLLGYVHSDTVYNFVPGDQIPQLLKDATVAIEDRRFYQHGALDYQGILRAGIKDVFGGGSSMQGASTLTMQLVDNMYLPQKIRAHRDLKYKIIQAKLAEQLESHHTKRWILNTYLNDAPYGTVDGETARGVGAAAEVFFSQPVARLDLAQMALLAGLPQAPSEYNPFLAPALARHRRHDVLVAMMKAHYISRPQAVAADHSPLQVQHNQAYSSRAEPYVFDYAVQQAENKYGKQEVENGGLKIYTTITLHDQQLARQALLAHEGGAGNPAAALSTVDPSNGHIVAMASTASYSQTKFDYPVQAQRSPGSSFKLFALMTLIHDYHGDPGQTYYTSMPLQAGWLSSEPTWSVHTAELSYQGTINITRATIDSDNTVFAQLVVDLGMDKFDAMAHAMGITSPLEGNPAEVIGGLGKGVTTMEMADAYATVANGGMHVPPTIIDHVAFPDGSVDSSWGNPARSRVFSPGEAYAATQVLKQVITSGTGTNANYGCPAAGKTGTAENFSNAWFVGFTPKLSTAVWVGYPQGNNIPMANGFGGTLAAPIWHDFMSSASGGYCGDFTQPTDLFSGVAFFGNHSASGNPGVGTGSGNGKSGSSSGSGNGTGGVAPNPYGNRSLYAQPPQPGAGKLGGTGTTGGGKTGGTTTGTGGGKTGGGTGTTGGSGGGKTGGTGSGGTGSGGSGTGGTGVPSH